jgi:SAM-dependent methyltransferase
MSYNLHIMMNKISETTELRNYFESLGFGKSYQSDAYFELLCEAAKQSENDVILDAGCGHQRFKPFFKNCLYIGQEHPVAGKENKDLTTYDILCDVKSIPLKDESVSAVLSTSSLEHFEYPQEFFDESHRILKPGGKIFIVVPACYPMHEVPFDFQRPTKYGLIRHLRHSGFTEENISVNAGTCDLSTGTFMLEYAASKFIKSKQKSFQRKFLKLFLAALIPPINKVRSIASRIEADEMTDMPIVWIAVATKEGCYVKNEKTEFGSSKDFLNANLINNL